MTNDYILVEGDLHRIKDFVAHIESSLTINVTKQPTIGLTMVRAADSVESQEFYLGEVLITECEISIDNIVGIGICTGDEPVRSYCMAVVDAVMKSDFEQKSMAEDFLKKEAELILSKEDELKAMINKTKVDFKLMDQS